MRLVPVFSPNLYLMQPIQGDKLILETFWIIDLIWHNICMKQFRCEYFIKTNNYLRYK
jgi:hypothetical protein